MNNPKRLSLSVCLFFFGSIFFTLAQVNDTQNSLVTQYTHAVNLYNNKAYSLAQKSFQKLLDDPSAKRIHGNAAYYEAISAVKMDEPYAYKKVEAFVSNYPRNQFKDQAYLVVGDYYFKNKKPAQSLRWYNLASSASLSREKQQELLFKTGYALLATRNLDLASTKFKALLNDPTYGNDARYYYGYIAYQQENYTEAETTLKTLATQEAYQKETAYYLLDISFKAGRFKECITMGLALLDQVENKEKSDINKIIGESYFNLGNYEEAIPYLRGYRGTRGKWTTADYYQLGYAYFKQNDFENARNNFNKIISEKSAVAQNAYYNLGECYLYLDKKGEALHAFKNASEMDFDAKIQEDAALNYAKLSYEEGNPYESVANVLLNFLERYPKSSSYQQISDLVVSSFLYQQDYEGALDYLSKNKNTQNNETALEVSYYQGVALYNKQLFLNALPYFEAAKDAEDESISQKAAYWEAESYYQLNDFSAALTRFLQFQSSANKAADEEFTQTNYAIGYCYFKLKEYTKAARYFDSYIAQKNKDTDLAEDAILRLADAHFGLKSYTKAISSYKNVITKKSVGADYAQYQLAMSYGLLNNQPQKITELLTLLNEYSTSSFKDDALFQLGNTYALEKDNNNAHGAYERLVQVYAKSLYVPSAMLRNGLLYYNDGENEKALAIYKQIAAQYPNAPEAKEAVANARNVYVEIGKVEEYAAWVKNIKFVTVSNADIDNTTYEAAESKMLANNKEAANIGFTKYLKNFPEGIHALAAHFYLAQILFDAGDKEAASTHYQYVVSKEQSNFSEVSLSKLSQFHLEKGNWTEAIPLLERLEVEANAPENIVFAQRNLMKGYYDKERFSDAVTYAKKIVNEKNTDPSIAFDAKIILARSAFKSNDLALARSYYTALAKEASGEIKAEALYYKALFLHNDKKYEASTKVVQDLISNLSSYKYWGAKSFIIMAKNYYDAEKSDPYQATYILENIIKNFTQFDDVIKEASAELDRIKKKEAQTNDSITPKNK